MVMSLAKKDKVFITEILNDLYQEGFVSGGKAETMLRDWARELREIARPELPPSRLRREFNQEIGAYNW